MGLRRKRNGPSVTSVVAAWSGRMVVPWRRSVTALQDAESVRTAQIRTQAEQRTAMQAGLLPYLGRLERSIDGSLLAVGSATAALSGKLRKWQTGFSRSYALSMLAGAFVLFAMMLVVRL